MPMITDEEFTEYWKWKETHKQEVSEEPAQEEFPTTITSRIKMFGFVAMVCLIILSIVIWLSWPALAGAVNQSIDPGYQSPSIRTYLPVN